MSPLVKTGVAVGVPPAASSSLSVSVRGKGRGISGATSIKFQGSSSYPVWLASK